MSHKENCDKVDQVDQVDIQMETEPEKAASFVGPVVVLCDLIHSSCE